MPGCTVRIGKAFVGRRAPNRPGVRGFESSTSSSQSPSPLLSSLSSSSSSPPSSLPPSSSPPSPSPLSPLSSPSSSSSSSSYSPPQLSPSLALRSYLPENLPLHISWPLLPVCVAASHTSLPASPPPLLNFQSFIPGFPFLFPFLFVSFLCLFLITMWGTPEGTMPGPGGAHHQWPTIHPRPPPHHATPRFLILASRPPKARPRP